MLGVLGWEGPSSVKHSRLVNRLGVVVGRMGLNGAPRREYNGSDLRFPFRSSVQTHGSTEPAGFETSLRGKTTGRVKGNDSNQAGVLCELTQRPILQSHLLMWPKWDRMVYLGGGPPKTCGERVAQPTVAFVCCPGSRASPLGSCC
jgi:hypothetical protein